MFPQRPEISKESNQNLEAEFARNLKARQEYKEIFELVKELRFESDYVTALNLAYIWRHILKLEEVQHYLKRSTEFFLTPSQVLSQYIAKQTSLPSIFDEQKLTQILEKAKEKGIISY